MRERFNSGRFLRGFRDNSKWIKSMHSDLYTAPTQTPTLAYSSCEYGTQTIPWVSNTALARVFLPVSEPTYRSGSVVRGCVIRRNCGLLLGDCVNWV